MKQGLVHLYCGDGKGKTTAAIGLWLLAGSAVALLQDTEGGAGCVWVVCVV